MSVNEAKKAGEESPEVIQAMHDLESFATEMAGLEQDTRASIDACKDPEFQAKARMALANVREFCDKGLSVLRGMCQDAIAMDAMAVANAIDQNEYRKMLENIDHTFAVVGDGLECAYKLNDAVKSYEDTERAAEGDTAPAPPQGNGGGRAPRA